MSMTWGQFKALIDKTVPDDTEIWFIDVSWPEEKYIKAWIDDIHGLAVC